MECFFIDSAFVPIMVHENYLNSMKKGKLTKKDFHKLVKANDALKIQAKKDGKKISTKRLPVGPVDGHIVDPAKGGL